MIHAASLSTQGSGFSFGQRLQALEAVVAREGGK